MSDVQFSWTSGKTVDAFLTNGSDQWYRTDTHVFEAYNAANFDATRQPDRAGRQRHYIGTLPTTGVVAANYSVHVRERQAA
jgi:hypothetical protein